MGEREGRTRHQYELCGSAGSDHGARAGRCRQEGHRADRSGRQCRTEIAAAVSGLRSERDRGHRDRLRGQAVPGLQSRTSRRGRGAWRRTCCCRHRAAATA